MVSQYEKVKRRRLLMCVLICCLLIPVCHENVLAAAESEEEVMLQSEPEEKQEPEVTEQPEITEEPGSTEEPQATEIPEATGEPEVTDEPELSLRPGDLLSARAKEGWITAANGKIWYQYNDGSYPSNGWKQIGSRWYYFDSAGWLKTGWLNIDSGTYYLKQTGEAGIKGAMLTGWQKLSGQVYYFKKSGQDAGKMLTGWQQLDHNNWYYFSASRAAGVGGRLWTGWLKQGGSIYYLKQTGAYGTKGRMLTGWQTMGGRLYYFKRSGSGIGKMFTGLVGIGGEKFYFETGGTYGIRGSAATGWKTISGNVYRFEQSGDKGVKGKALTGWRTYGKYKFYFMCSGSYKGKMLTGFNNIAGERYFFKRTGDYELKGAMFKGWQNIDGKKYYFGTDGKMRKNTVVNGNQLGPDGAVITGKTLKALLTNALKPMGSTLYVLGGGHDVGTGGDGVRYGVNPNWKKFFSQQGANYNHSRYSYQYGKGLDCSGYVGWVVYNTVNKQSNQEICTSISETTPKLYGQRGWGNYADDWNSGKFKAGDVVSYYNSSNGSGHVWLVIGQCGDGSVVLAHSTPPAGVILSGTATSGGNMDSEAIQLARKYMKQNFSACYNKFSSLTYQCPREYLYGPSNLKLHRFQWDVSGKKLLSDPEGYMKKTAGQILADLF